MCIRDRFSSRFALGKLLTSPNRWCPQTNNRAYFHTKWSLLFIYLFTFDIVVLTCCNISGAIHGSTATACDGNWWAIWLLSTLPWTGKNIHLFNPDKHTSPFAPIKIWLPFNALCQQQQKIKFIGIQVLQKYSKLQIWLALHENLTLEMAGHMFLLKQHAFKKMFLSKYLWIIPILWRYSRPCKISHRIAETNSSHMPSGKLFFNMSAQDPS